ncbi:MFS transporter [Gluconacetobacter sacchari]|uniref:MFS transporter n=1 Tax=Gluconacetobacter sacchari TaxID=92759 RepID=UPI0039B6ACBF
MQRSQTESLEEAPAAASPATLNMLVLIPILLLMAATYVFYGWDRLVMPVELVEMRKTLNLDQRSAGLMASIFTLGIAVLSIPAGMLVARLGLRMALGLSTLVFSGGTLLSGAAKGILALLIGRLATGAGESVFSIAFFMIIVALFPRWRGTAIGGATAIFGLSMFVGPRVVLALQAAGSGDWRFPFRFMGCGGVLAGLLLLFCVPQRLRAEEKTASRPQGWGWLRSRTLPAVYAMAAVNGLCCYAYMSLFQTYARVGQHLTPAEASFAFGCFGIGNILGGVPIGLVLDRTDRLRGVGILSALTGIAAAVLFLWPLHPTSAIVLSLIFGIGIGGIYGNCYALARENAPEARASLAIGILLTVYYLGASSSGYFFVLAMGDDFTANVRGALVMFLVPYLIASAIMLTTRRQT